MAGWLMETSKTQGSSYDRVFLPQLLLLRFAATATTTTLLHTIIIINNILDCSSLSCYHMYIICLFNELRRSSL